MEAMAIALLISVVSGLILFIVNRVAANTHALRTEMQTGLNLIRAELNGLQREMGALQERTKLYDMLDQRLNGDKH